MEPLAESGDNGAGASISVFILLKSSQQATTAWGADIQRWEVEWNEKVKLCVQQKLNKFDQVCPAID